MSEVGALKDAVTRGIDLVEVVEGLAADMHHTLDQIQQIHVMIFAASTAPEAEAMGGGLELIKKGLEDVYQGVNAFRDQGNQYVGRL